MLRNWQGPGCLEYGPSVRAVIGSDSWRSTTGAGVTRLRQNLHDRRALKLLNIQRRLAPTFKPRVCFEQCHSAIRCGREASGASIQSDTYQGQVRAHHLDPRCHGRARLERLIEPESFRKGSVRLFACTASEARITPQRAQTSLWSHSTSAAAAWESNPDDPVAGHTCSLRTWWAPVPTRLLIVEVSTGLFSVDNRFKKLGPYRAVLVNHLLNRYVIACVLIRCILFAENGTIGLGPCDECISAMRTE